MILDSIYNGADRDFINGLLRAGTWATVYDQVAHKKPGLFNALNLATLQTGRPSPLEAPAECSRFRTNDDFLSAWSAWYMALDEPALPRADAQSAAGCDPVVVVRRFILPQKESASNLRLLRGRVVTP